MSFSKGKMLGILFLLATIFIALAFSNVITYNSFVGTSSHREGFGQQSIKEGLVSPPTLQKMKDSIQNYLSEDSAACEEFIQKVQAAVTSRASNTSDPDVNIILNLKNILTQNSNSRPEFTVGVIGAVNRLPTALNKTQMDIANAYATLLGNRLASAIVTFQGLYAINPGLNPTPPAESDNPPLLTVIKTAITTPVLPGSVDSDGKPNSSAALIQAELAKESAAASAASSNAAVAAATPPADAAAPAAPDASSATSATPLAAPAAAK
jgi:hypothetical protein